MIRMTADHTNQGYCALIESLIAMMDDSQLGVVDGNSIGNGYIDINFDVANLQISAKAIDAWLQQRIYPMGYLISDHYEVRFEEPTYGTIPCVAALLTDPTGAILMQQRDNNPAIAFPHYWALPGGHVEAGEDAQIAIQRELIEEMEYHDSVEFLTSYVFWKSADILVYQHVFVGTIDQPIEQIPLHEGQALRYISQHEIEHYPIAFGYGRVCRHFWKSHDRR